MICYGIKSKAYLEWWRLLKYTFGDVKNVEFFFIFQIFSRALKDFIKSSNLGATQPKIDYLRQEKIGYYLPTNCR